MEYSDDDIANLLRGMVWNEEQLHAASKEYYRWLLANNPLAKATVKALRRQGVPKEIVSQLFEMCFVAGAIRFSDEMAKASIVKPGSKGGLHDSLN